MRKFVSALLIILILFVQPLVSYSKGEDFWAGKSKVSKRINKLGKDILKSNHIYKHLVFQVIKRTNVANAFAGTTSNEVLITSALLDYINSDDEVAAILSHEISHIVNGDGKRTGSKVAVLFPLLLVEACVGLYTAPLTSLILNNWSRKYEYEADLRGLDLMTKAGYDPYAMILAYNKFLANSEAGAAYSTHPPTQDRIAYLYNFIQENYPQYKNSKFLKAFRDDSIFDDFIVKKEPKLNYTRFENYRFLVPGKKIQHI